MDTVKISCEISCNRDGLHLRAAVADQILFDGDPSQCGQHHITLPDTDGNHELTFTLSGKTSDHTKIDASGEIIEDVVVKIQNICFDDIQLGQTFIENAEYTHDFNGTAKTLKDKFYGIMGCNGTVALKFTTPVYLWLLENM